MKYDMHCHTAEGSPDSRVSIIEYAAKLKNLGYTGMLVTDHDTYKGYRKYKKELTDKCPEDFYILKGIEYDTIDAGHFLVILPTGQKLRILELRGLPVYLLMDIVHKHGGILGPAHPFGERYLSIFHTGIYKHHKAIAEHFDFIEGFNACEDASANDAAMEIASQYNLPCFGGSDSHRIDNVGHAFTDFDITVPITTEDELIEFVKSKKSCIAGGERFYGTTKDKLGIFNHILVQGFWFYNKGLGLARRKKRTKEMKKISGKLNK